MRPLRRPAALAIALLGLACSDPKPGGLSVLDGGPDSGNESPDAGPRDPLEGTLVEGSPMCSEPVWCCQPVGLVLPGVTATSATVASIETTTDGTLVHLTVDGETRTLAFVVEPDLAVGDELGLERTDLGVVVRDETGVVAVFGQGTGFHAELAFADTTLRPVLSCHGFIPHPGGYDCPDVLIADYMLQVGETELALGERADVALSEGIFHVRNHMIRQRVDRGDGTDCLDDWQPVLSFTVTRRAK